MRQPDITLKGKAGIATIARGCACWVSDTETVSGIVTAIAEPLDGATDRALVVTDRDLAAGATGGGYIVGVGSGTILLKAGAAVAKGDTLAIADTAGRWRPATENDQWVPFMAVNGAAVNGLLVAVPHLNLPFYSTERTGSGAEHSIAHGLRRVPRCVRWRVTQAPGAFTVTPGSHTASQVKITVTNNVKYVVEAWI